MTIQAVLFDWGDTVMRVFPEYDGPMVRWPRVEIIPEIAQTLRSLRSLHPQYRLGLATNADDSGEVLVRAALRRAEIEEHFDYVFTARELGARKPDPAFFRAALQGLGCAPQAAVMVGDDYKADVLGAKAVGLKAIWFNPSQAPCPPGHPQYDAELRAMSELPTTLETMRLPDVAECMAWLAEQETSPNLIAHVETVAMIAFRLAVWLRAAGEQVDPLLAHRGGLLHDLDKLSANRRGEKHGQLSAKILMGKGQPELAVIVERHVMSAILKPATRPTTWEEKLVFYADKLAEGSQIISVPERMQALYLRYPQYVEIFQRSVPLVLEMEQDLCARLGLAPAELIRKLRSKSSS